jgi:nijmegen breakage syndrome protein 1
VPAGGRFRRTVTTRFTAFDSDSDDEPPTTNIFALSQAPIDSAPAIESQSQGLFVSQDPEMDVELETQPKRSKKRNSPPNDYDMNDGVEFLAPTATKRKKQRLAEEVAQRRDRGESTPVPPEPEPLLAEKSSPGLAKPRKVREEVDVAEEIRKTKEKHEKAEELAREEREKLAQQLEGMNIEQIRNLSKVEIMEVSRQRAAPVRTGRADESVEWDDAWNGRRNFKKFRRRGGDGVLRDPNRVIVPLEVMKHKDYGIGDEYWLETSGNKKKKNTQLQLQGRESKAEQRAAKLLAQEAEEHRLAQEQLNAQAELDDMMGIKPAPSSDLESVEALRGVVTKTMKLIDKTTREQNLPASKKRAASTPLTKPVQPKKIKQFLVEDSDEDSDDDELKFRFKRK